MKFKRLKIQDVVLCEPEFFSDDRGYFYESFRQDKFESFIGHDISFCQENESKSVYGVLRGLHYQTPPYAQSKLVRVLRGRVLDFALDMRRDSPTLGQFVMEELSEENKKQLFVPRGFAHGFVVLSKEAVFTYKVDNYYSKTNEKSVNFNDPFLAIDLQIPKRDLILSEKDLISPMFENSVLFENSDDLYK